MKSQYTLASAVLWAAAIIAAAAFHAPAFLALVLLPSLAAVSLLVQPVACRTRSTP